MSLQHTQMIPHHGPGPNIPLNHSYNNPAFQGDGTSEYPQADYNSILRRDHIGHPQYRGGHLPPGYSSEYMGHGAGNAGVQRYDHAGQIEGNAGHLPPGYRSEYMGHGEGNTGGQMHDHARGQIHPDGSFYDNALPDRNGFGSEGRGKEARSASIVTLDPTQVDTGIRRRYAKNSVGNLWESVKQSTRVRTYQGLPSRGSANPHRSLSQRKYNSSGQETEGNLILDQLSERQRVISQQSKTGTGFRRKSFYKLRRQVQEVSGQLEVWAKSLKVIEGHFGSAILSYFTFVRWLMFLNLFIGVLLFCIITMPYLLLEPKQTFTQYAAAVNITTDPYLNTAVICSTNYSDSVTQIVKDRIVAEYVLDFLQGTGFMENTVLFYGNYFNKTLAGFNTQDVYKDHFSVVYNMSLAYLLATGTYFIVSFLLIIKHLGAGLKEGVLNQETSLTKYCNKVLTAWDFCITDESKAKLKHRNLKKEFEADLFEQQMEKDRAARITSDWVKLYLIRIFINLCVVCILVGSLALIYLTNQWSLGLQQQKILTDQFVVLLVQYLPSITITILNVIVPVLFDKMVLPEGYSPAFELKMTLSRQVLLRLASIGILLISLYDQVVANTDLGATANFINQGICAAVLKGDNSSEPNALCEANTTSVVKQCGNKDFSQIKCWETYVGQQLYKLVLLDFIVVLLGTLLVEFPRKLLYKHFHSKSRLINWLGKQQFDIPRNVLDIVYCQTLCWLGAFFSPLIPVISMIKYFIFFYIKKLTLLQNCDPPEKTFRTSRSNSFFMTVLLISFIMASIPIGYIVSRIPPSQSCGPFRVYSEEEYFMFHTLTNLIHTFPDTARNFFYFFGSVAFYVPATILLCLLMFYFWAVGQGYKKMGELLQDQLAMEGKDKQYLLLRVTEALKRG